MFNDKWKRLLNDDNLMAKNIVDYAKNAASEEEQYESIKEIIQKHIQEILVGKCVEDIVLTEKETEKLPSWIKHYLRYSKKGGINFYVLCKNDLKFMIVGTLRSTNGYTNLDIMEKIIQDPNIKARVNTTEFQLSETLGKPGKWLKMRKDFLRKLNIE